MPVTELEDLARTRDAHVAALNAGDADGLVSCFTPDGVQMPPNEPGALTASGRGQPECSQPSTPTFGSRSTRRSDSDTTGHLSEASTGSRSPRRPVASRSATTASTSRCTGATLTASGGSPETSGTATGPLPDRRPERTIGAATNRPARSNHAGKRQAPSPATGSRPGAGLSVGDSADSGTIEARRYPAGVNSGATTICDREVVLSRISFTGW